MKSKTKNIISQEQIKKLVEVNFGDSYRVGKITELKGGMFNSAYMIEHRNQSDRMVLKVSVAPGTPLLTYEQDIMPTEVNVYKMFKEHYGVTPVEFKKKNMDIKTVSED